MGTDANDDPNGEEDSSPAETARALWNRGKRKAKEVSTEAQQRLHAYNQNPELLEQDLKALAQDGRETGKEAADRIREAGGIRELGESVSDEAARQAGWSDTTEMVQAYGADTPAVEAYMDSLPADILGETGKRFDSARFDADAFASFPDASLADAADPLTYAVSVKSEAYLREQDVETDGVFVEYTTDAESLQDINEETTVHVNFYAVD